MQCLKCKNQLKEEVYNQQWGMIQFYSHCTLDIKKKVSDECDEYVVGNPQIKYMSEKEKRKLPIY